MKRAFSALAAVIFLGLTSGWLMGAVPNLPAPSCAEASQLYACLQQLVVNMNSPGSTGINPNTMATFSNFRNLLDNGNHVIAQRGTAERTCAQNASASTVAAYTSDRWTCQANVAVGAGFAQVKTSSPTPPPGFQNELAIYRKTGALAQPVCALQEIATSESVPLQGQTVTFSAYVQALSATSNTGAGQPVTLVVFTGTGTDEGFGTQGSASAIPPAWTGIATAVSTAFTTSTATTWQRYSTTAAIPLTATEVGVAICYTPSASGTAGTTDGIAFTGAQLEVGSTPSAYEFKPTSYEQQRAQRTYYQYADNLAATFNIGNCQDSSTTVAICVIPTPVTMRTTPTPAIATATSYAVTVPAGTTQACTTLAVIASSGGPNQIALSCTVAANLVAGNAARFTYSNTGAANTITVSADF